MVMKPTRATPIMSAAAVADVRLGLRMAFSRASVPGHALQAGQRRAEHPAERPGQDRAEHGDADEDQRHAEADGHERRVAAGEEALRDGRRTEAGDDRCRSTARRRLLPELSTATSRMAATGATRLARRAGRSAEATLTPSPATSEMTTVDDVSTMPPAGMSMPMASSITLRPDATPMPAARPTTEAMSPTTTASSSTEPSTWRRLAPMARSSAISRPRWATRIEKEL